MAESRQSPSGLGSGKRPLGLVLALLLVVLSVPLWLSPRVTGPSVGVRTAEGFLGLRLLLEHWGTSVEVAEYGERAGLESLIDEVAEGTPAATASSATVSLDRIAPGRSLLVSFPVGRAVLPLADDLRARIRNGEEVLVTYSGAPLAFEEIDFFATLGVRLEPFGSQGSILPWEWWRRQRGGQAFNIAEQGPVKTEEHLVADGLSSLPRVGAQCVALTEGIESEGQPEPAPPPAPDSESGSSRRVEDQWVAKQAAVMRCSLGQGTLWLAPTSMFANDRVHNPGNVELLWHLRQDLGSEWTVIEGGAPVLAGTASANARGARATLNTLALQLALLYLGALLALAWSFGPRWGRAGVPPDGHRGFLLGVGALHQRLEQLPQAARLLHERWLEYDALARRRQLEEVPTTSELTPERLVEWAATRSRSGSDVRMNSKGGKE